ncbi:MAG: Gfo/Idh/MocA family protein [Dongiaceae bacterium]
MSTKKLRIAAIGIGKQSKKYLHALTRTENLILDAVVDKDEKCLVPFKTQIGLSTYPTVDELIACKKPDVALVCVTHSDHLDICSKLAAAGIHVIKEKPFALNTEEAKKYEELCKQYNIKILTTVKRRFDPIYAAFPTLFRGKIGKVFYFEGKYLKNIPDLGEGWRANFEQAGGGALIDIGYHFIDLAVWYFGKPASMHASFGFNNRPHQQYNVEDTAALQMCFDNVNVPPFSKIVGQITISRTMPIEQESFMIVGSEGCVIISEGKAMLYDSKGKLVSQVQNDPSFDANVAMLDYFAKQIGADSAQTELQLAQVDVIETAYRQINDNVPMKNLVMNSSRSR